MCHSSIGYQCYHVLKLNYCYVGSGAIEVFLKSCNNTSHIHLVILDIFACVPMSKVSIWKCYLSAAIVLLQHSSFLFYFQCLLKYQWYFDVVFRYLCLCSSKVSIWKCYLNDVVVLLWHSSFLSDFQSMPPSQSGDPFVLVLFKCFHNTFTRCPRFSALFV